MTAFKIDIKDGGVTAAMNDLIAAARNPEPALRAIGEALYGPTRRTFETSTDPWGRRWVPNAPSTIDAMLARTGSNFRKRDGKLSAKGAGRVMSKRPLIGETGALSGSSIDYDIESGALVFGSSAKQAAMQQFGGLKSEFPHLWGNIPARQFLPVDQAGNLAPDAQRTVVDTIQEYLLNGK